MADLVDVVAVLLLLKPKVAMLAAMAFFCSPKICTQSSNRINVAGMISGRKYDTQRYSEFTSCLMAISSQMMRAQRAAKMQVKRRVMVTIFTIRPKLRLFF